MWAACLLAAACKSCYAIARGQTQNRPALGLNQVSLGPLDLVMTQLKIKLEMLQAQQVMAEPRLQRCAFAEQV